jgi:hypothetical protein
MNNLDIEKYFDQEDNKNLTNSELFNLLRSAVQTHEFSNATHQSFGERYLVYQLCLSSVYQFYLTINQEDIFQFGIEMEPKANYENYIAEHKKNFKPVYYENNIDLRRVKEISVKGVSFTVIYLQKITDISNLETIFLLPSITPEYLERVKTTFIFCSNYFQSINEKSDNLKFLYSDYKEKIKNTILSFPYKDRVNGILAHFYFEDMQIYNEKMGEQFTENIIKEISEIISKHLKKQDMIVIMNQRSYLTYLPDCSLEVVKKRFSEVFFKLNQLILKFDLEFYEVRPSNINDEFLLDRIFI